MHSLVILLCAVALSACTSDADRRGTAPNNVSPGTSAGPSPTLEPSPSPTFASGCANERDATRSNRLRRGRLTGDLDGDGSDEVVRLALDESGARGCQAFIVVRSSTIEGITAIDVSESVNVSPNLGLPALDSIKPIGFGPGDEVVLVLWTGASTQFFGLATVVDGNLVQVTIEDSAYDMFPYGGSVTHLEGSDCAKPSEGSDGSTIVISGASTNDGEHFRLERRFFVSSEGAELLPEPGSTERKVVSFDELVSYPEFGEAPFAHCG
jgi:hypothetical protein